MKYIATIKPVDWNESDTFSLLHQYDPEAVFELLEEDADGNEVYTVTANADLGTWLDSQPGVINYEKE